jgi:hypothetical protein
MPQLSVCSFSYSITSHSIILASMSRATQGKNPAL